MSGVSIADFAITVDGVKWTAHWDDKGNISYTGVDKEGKEVTVLPPSSVVKAAKDYGASQGNGGEDGRKKGEGDWVTVTEDFVTGLRVEEFKDGRVRVDIGDAWMTSEQKQHHENLKKEAFISQKSSFGFDDLAAFVKDNNLTSCSFEPKTGKVVARDKNGMVNLSEQQEKLLSNIMGTIHANSDRKKGLDELKRGFNSLGNDPKANLKDLGEIDRFPVNTVEDIYKASKLIANGKFRELRDKTALRVHDNLIAMGVLPRGIEKRIEDANKRIEERLGIEGRESKPSVFVEAGGNGIRGMRGALRKLSGRGENQSIRGYAVAGKSNDRGFSR
ncbi:MAG: hypothetical protein E7020_03555 [Alphaproteobacteria bacterium]|nr:hypothetical protein [Alphaproteobacteria bacterium]